MTSFRTHPHPPDSSLDDPVHLERIAADGWDRLEAGGSAGWGVDEHEMAHRARNDPRPLSSAFETCSDAFFYHFVLVGNPHFSDFENVGLRYYSTPDVGSENLFST